MLWERYVLNELHARLQSRRMNLWRDKHGHEVDFICRPRIAVPAGAAPNAGLSVPRSGRGCEGRVPRPADRAPDRARRLTHTGSRQTGPGAHASRVGGLFAAPSAPQNVVAGT